MFRSLLVLVILGSSACDFTTKPTEIKQEEKNKTKWVRTQVKKDSMSVAELRQLIKYPVHNEGIVYKGFYHQREENGRKIIDGTYSFKGILTKKKENKETKKEESYTETYEYSGTFMNGIKDGAFVIRTETPDKKDLQLLYYEANNDVCRWGAYIAENESAYLLNMYNTGKYCGLLPSEYEAKAIKFEKKENK